MMYNPILYLIAMWPLLILFFVIVFCVGMAKVFSKAGFPWIFFFVPIANIICLTMIAFGRDKWYYVFLFLVPFVNGIFTMVMLYRVAINFGQSVVVGVLNIFFSPLVMCYLGLSQARYCSKESVLKDW